MKDKYKLPAGYKLCPKCERVLPVEQFYHCQRSKDGRNSTCRECVIKRVLAYYHNPRNRRRYIAVQVAYQKRKALERQLGA